MTFRHECQEDDTMPRKTHIAFVYDFDRTLSTSEMQDALIRKLGLVPKEFWKSTNEYAKEHNMDKNLAYLYCLRKECANRLMAINRDVLHSAGEEVEFFKGVEEWFDHIDNLAKELGVVIEHYVISSGMKEIIEGTSIAKRFERIYACEYHYDENGVPVWVNNVINFTSKTQFLFRINKGKLDIWDEKGVNEYIPHDERRIPFENMIYFGDGETDIPCMKLVKNYGGHSIGVYSRRKQTVQQMMYDERIDFYCKADYSTGGELYAYVENVVRMIAYNYPLMMRALRQYNESKNAIEGKSISSKSDSEE